MEDRITDIGPQHFEQFYPEIIKKNKGKWLYHEILKPGVLVHVSETGDEVYTVRVGGARFMSITHIREICEIADKHCDGHLRFTTRNNIEFMVDSKDKVDPLIKDLESRKFDGGSFKFPVGRYRCRYHQHRSYPGLDPLPYTGNRCFRHRESNTGRSLF